MLALLDMLDMLNNKSNLSNKISLKECGECYGRKMKRRNESASPVESILQGLNEALQDAKGGTVGGLKKTTVFRQLPGKRKKIDSRE